MSPPYRSQSLHIGQPQVEQHDVNRTLREIFLGLVHARRVHQLDVVRAELIEHLTEQTDVSGVVFDEKQPRG